MTLPDVLAHDLQVVFCGTAVGTTSAQRGEYYAGRGNIFWRALYQANFTPTEFRPRDYMQLLPLHLGLTDLVKCISGNDDVLSKCDFDRDRLNVMIQKFRPKILAFTSKRAAQEFISHPVEYGRLTETIGDTILFVLPSPSGAARKFWKIERWQELSQLRYRI